MKKRRYTKRHRASQEQRTRDRIVAAAIELHEKLGPAGTTISAIAERAGVQRLTVYRHFPTDRELFGACSSRWSALHPPPEIGALRGDSPESRTRAAVLALYRYYRDTAGMWTSVYRDRAKVAAVDGALAGFEGYLADLGKTVIAAWPAPRSAELRATVTHALRFSTWQSLAEQKLDAASMAELATRWIRASAGAR